MVEASGVAHFVIQDVLRPARMVVKIIVQELAFVARFVAAKDSTAARQELVALHSEVLYSAPSLYLAHPFMVALDDLTVRKGHLRSDQLLFAVAAAVLKELVFVAMRDEADAARKGLEGEARGKVSHSADGPGETIITRPLRDRFLRGRPFWADRTNEKGEGYYDQPRHRLGLGCTWLYVTPSVETLVSMIHGMQLCVPIPGREQDWFPAFLHNSNIEDFEREVLSLGSTAPCESVKAHFEDLTDEDIQNGICCGRLVSLRSAARSSASNWQVFPRGTFSRFQVKVLEAFPDPILDVERQQQHGTNQSMHSSLGRPFIDRDVVEVVWEGDTKEDRAMCICQMLYDKRTRLEVAWIAWIWTASPGAARHLLAHGIDETADFSPILVQVATQLQACFISAATVSGRTPDMFSYRLHHRAFLKAAGKILREPKNILSKSWKDWDSQPSERKRRKAKFEMRDYSGEITRLREQAEKQKNAEVQKDDLAEVLATLRPLERKQEEQIANQEEQGANIKVLLKYSKQTFAGYHHVPCTPLILPASIARELRAVFEERDPSRWRRLKRFLTDRTRILKEKKYLYFWCPVTGRIAETNDGRGYELEVPREWVTKYAKLVQVLRVLLDISLLVVGAVTGGGRLLSNIVEIVKTPDLPPEFDYLREYISENNEPLERMNDEILEQNEAGTSADEVKATEARSPDPVSSDADSESYPCIREPLIVFGEHYGALVKTLMELGYLTSAGRVFQCDATQAAPETDVFPSLSQVAQRSFMAPDFSG
eukprot:scaffold3374_cov153-Pinguiococcus_pyrenoidosus.AAC.2